MSRTGVELAFGSKSDLAGGEHSIFRK